MTLKTTAGSPSVGTNRSRPKPADVKPGKAEVPVTAAGRGRPLVKDSWKDLNEAISALTSKGRKPTSVDPTTMQRALTAVHADLERLKGTNIALDVYAKASPEEREAMLADAQRKAEADRANYGKPKRQAIYGLPGDE